MLVQQYVLVHVLGGLQRSGDAFEEVDVAGLGRVLTDKMFYLVLLHAVGVMKGEKLWNTSVRVVVLFLCQVDYNQYYLLETVSPCNTAWN